MADDDVTSTHAGGLRQGRYVVFDGEACIVKDVQTSKTGKHGHAKARVEATKLKDGKNIVKVMPAHDKVDVPIIQKKNAQVLTVNGDSANVMDLESYETFDLKISEELKDKVKEGVQVHYWIVLGEKIVQEVKSS